MRFNHACWIHSRFTSKVINWGREQERKLLSSLMFRTFTQELGLLASCSNEYVIIYTTWSYVSGTSLYYQCSFLSNSCLCTYPLVPYSQVFRVQLAKQEMYVHSYTGRTENKTQVFPRWTNVLTTELQRGGGYCCLHLCSSSSCVSLVPHFSFMSGLMECFVLKTKQDKNL